MMDKRFFLQKADKLAPQLLGCEFHYQEKKSLIVETEAYLGQKDQACHASKGVTKRTKTMFEAGGIFYIYLVYGIHYMLNIVSGPKGSGEAVLIRALEPLNYKASTNGPGKLSKALGVTKNLNAKEAFPHIVKTSLSPQIVSCPRIGIDYAGESRDLPLRFYIDQHPYVSKYYEP